MGQEQERGRPTHQILVEKASFIADQGRVPRARLVPPTKRAAIDPPSSFPQSPRSRAWSVAFFRGVPCVTRVAGPGNASARTRPTSMTAAQNLSIPSRIGE